MKLTEARALFFKLRDENRIDIAEEHVIWEHAERGYSVDEIIMLIRSKSGRFADTDNMRYKGSRFYWWTNDLSGKSLRMVIEFDEDEEGQLIVVVSAGERK